MAVFDGSFREIFLSQAVSMAGGLIAGLAMVSYRQELFLVPGLLIIISGFL